MKLEEAIKILEEIDKSRPTFDLHHWREAIRLGIAALKTYQDVRRFLAQLPSALLPGETEE